MHGREDAKQIEPIEFSGAIAFFDSRFVSGVACVREKTNEDEKNAAAVEKKKNKKEAAAAAAATTTTNGTSDNSRYTLATFEIHGANVRLKKTIAESLNERINALFYWRRAPAADGTPNALMVAITVDVGKRAARIRISFLF